MNITTAPLMAVLATAMLLTACASDGDGWMGHHHDHDHDRDREHHDDHLMGMLAQPAGPPAPVVAAR